MIPDVFSIGAGRYFQEQTKTLLAELLTARLKTGRGGEGESVFTTARELKVLFSPQVLIKSSVGVTSSSLAVSVGISNFPPSWLYPKAAGFVS